MSVLLEYECRVPVGGYDVITIEDEYRSRKIRMLHPRSKRTRRFDLFEFNSSAFLEFAQTPLTEDRIKDFADRYGPLHDDQEWTEEEYQWGRDIGLWFENIRGLRLTVELWRESTVTGDFSRVIGEVRRIGMIDEDPTGAPVALLLEKDPLSASPKLCIRPVCFLDALWA